MHRDRRRRITFAINTTSRSLDSSRMDPRFGDYAFMPLLLSAIVFLVFRAFTVLGLLLDKCGFRALSRGAAHFVLVGFRKTV